MLDPQDPADDHAAVRFPPPAVYVLSIGAAVLLHGQLPLHGPGGWSVVAGVLLGVIGGLFIGLALERFLRSGQNPEPWTATPSLLGDGVYALSRNPMYLGMALLQLGIGLGSELLWIALFTPLSMLAVLQLAIRREEAYLRRRFGAAYDAYCGRVRRWL